MKSASGSPRPFSRVAGGLVLASAIALGLAACKPASKPAPEPPPAPPVRTSSPASAKEGRPAAAVELPTVLGFKAPIHEANRLVAMVSGKEARPSLLAGQVQVTEFRLETYRYAPDRQTELVVESPLGTFGSSGADSDRAISLTSADGRFSITGVGWGWNRNTGVLVISNKVETSLRRPGAATNLPPVEVRSHRFEYNLNTGDARFLIDCEAIQPGQARLRAGALSSRLNARTDKPESITATNGVTLELLRPDRPGGAAGSGAVYSMSAEGERIDLSGPTTWKFNAGEGAADQLELLPSKDTYAARGHARLTLMSPGGTNGNSGLHATSNSTPNSNAAPLEIQSESIEGSPREIVFSGPVTAKHGDRLELKAGRVVASFENSPAPSGTAPSRPTRVEATGNVAARLQSGGNALYLRGGRMVYTLGEHDMIEVLENPAWESATHSGHADRFVLHPQVPSFQAVDNVAVMWRTAADPRSTNTLPVEVAARLLRVEPSLARFEGGVEARRGTWRMNTADLDLGLATNSVPNGFAARGGVILEYEVPPPGAEQADGKRRVEGLRHFGSVTTAGARQWRILTAEVTGVLGAKDAGPVSLDATGGVKIDNLNVTASGGRLRYRESDGLLRLTEDARLRTVSGLEIVGESGTSLDLDPKTERFSVDGRWRRMTFPSDALRGGASTNRVARH